MWSVLALVALGCAAPQRHTETDILNNANTSLDFVNRVREDLRRNNDDYALLDGPNQLEGPSGPGHHTPRLPYRKPFPGLPDQYLSLQDTRRGEGDWSQTRVDSNLTNQSATEFRSLAHSRHVKSVRGSKHKRMLNRDRGALRMRDEGQEVHVPSGTVPTDTPGSPLPPAPPRAPPAPARQGGSRAQRPPPPLPDQIDMAHARNPIITRIRLKGRLCQRSLMNMEGPTYDREGRQLRAAHEPARARGRPFPQTHAPALVLPKCCNCCKKSVLGCQ